MKRINEDCFRTCSDAHPVPGSRPFHPDDVEQEAQEFKTQVQALMKLYATVNRYVSAFQASSLRIAQGRMPLFLPKDTIGLERISVSEEWPALNSTEEHRLQRAFLHYELGCCLMRALSRLPTVENPPQSDSISSRFYAAGIDLSPPNPFGGFHHGLSMDEIWEMEVVESFIVSMYEMIYGSLCLDLFGSFRAAAREAPSGRSDVEVKTVRGWLEGTSHVLSGDVPGARLASWDPKEFIQKISHLGLSYLETVLSSNMNDQRELFQIGVNLAKHDYLGRLYDHDYLSKLPLGCKSSKEASLYFAASCKGWKYNMTWHFLWGKVLTRVGWVFYDEERRCQTLRLPTVADVSKTNQRIRWNSWQRFTDSYDGTWRRWSISKGTLDSVPELNLYVTKEDFRNIVFSNCCLLQPNNGPRNPLDMFGYLDAAAQRFRAHVQSVVENATVRLPSFGDIFPDGPVEVPSGQRQRLTRNPAGRRR